MRKLAGVFLVVVVLLLTMGGVASGANWSASCNGILVSSLAGQAGVVGELTRGFHQEFKDAGIPPGFFDVAGAHEHGGDVETCLGA